MTYDTGDGIASFIADGRRSALDDLDYDDLYRVDRDASLSLQDQCRAFLGDLLPRQVRNYLEVGAGTGLFTLGFLSGNRVENALVTDISHSMLSICRARVAADPQASTGSVAYALWDGENKCLADGAFDLVTGFSVLHHVLDYGNLLARLRVAMSDTGRAVFLEPSLAFHRALTDFMTHVIWNVPADDAEWTLDDRLRVFSWVSENHTNIKYCGDAFVLNAREDKHMFDSQAVALTARQAGFGHTQVIPFGHADEVTTTLAVYLRQLGLRPSAFEDLIRRAARMLPGPFAYLAADQCAPSLLIVLECEPRGAAAACAQPSPLEFTHPAPSFRFQIEVSTGSKTDGEMVLRLDGWIMGDTDVRYIRLHSSEGRVLRYPVAGIRVDVDAAINPQRHYPPDRTLFSGLLNVQEQTVAADGSTLDMVAETMDGCLYALGEVTPSAGQTCQLEAHDVLLPRLTPTSLRSSPTR